MGREVWGVGLEVWGFEIKMMTRTAEASPSRTASKIASGKHSTSLATTTIALMSITVITCEAGSHMEDVDEEEEEQDLDSWARRSKGW